MIITLTPDQTAAYYEGGFPAWRVEEDCLDDVIRAGIEESVAVLPADQSCVLFWITARGVL
jgi:hypothetical protein